MKFRYLIASLLAFALLAVGCTEEEMSSLKNIKVSNSYIGLPTEGGSESITLTAETDWSFNQDLKPGWLTVSPMNGGAGEFTFHSPHMRLFQTGKSSFRLMRGMRPSISSSPSPPTSAKLNIQLSRRSLTEQTEQSISLKVLLQTLRIPYTATGGFRTRQVPSIFMEPSMQTELQRTSSASESQRATASRSMDRAPLTVRLWNLWM